MTEQRTRLQAVACLSLLYGAHAVAHECRTVDLAADFGAYRLEAGGEQDTLGTRIGHGSAEGQMFNCAHTDVRFNKGFAVPMNPEVTGMQYRNQLGHLAVFETGLPGIGYAVSMSDRRSSQYLPLLANQPTETYDDNGMARSLGYRMTVHFVITDRLVAGHYRLGNEERAGFYGTSSQGEQIGFPQFRVSARFDVAAHHCEADDRMTPQQPDADDVLDAQSPTHCDGIPEPVHTAHDSLAGRVMREHQRGKGDHILLSDAAGDARLEPISAGAEPASREAVSAPATMTF